MRVHVLILAHVFFIFEGLYQLQAQQLDSLIRLIPQCVNGLDSQIPDDFCDLRCKTTHNTVVTVVGIQAELAGYESDGALDFEGCPLL